MSERPPKRRRDEVDDTLAIAATLEVDKSTRFWFPGGTVVIQAESTQFRVHWDILAARSEVFKDLFDLPQASTEPKVDGCPLVIVQDLAEDWAILFEVLYYSSPSPHKNYKHELAYYAPLMRLGRKYAFADFAEVSLDYVLSVLCLAVYDRSVRKINSLTLPSIYKLAAVAEELGSQVLLRHLYFAALTSLNLLEISEGFLVEGGPTLKFPPHFRRMLLTHRDEFAVALRKIYSWLVDPGVTPVIPVAACATRVACAAAFEIKQRSLIRQDIVVADLSDLDEVPGACEGCKTKIRALIRIRFGKFYDSGLPALFELSNSSVRFAN